jgi:hypothetical protein
MSEDTYLVFELDTLSTVPESIFISLSYPFTVDRMKVMAKSFDIDLNVQMVKIVQCPNCKFRHLSCAALMMVSTSLFCDNCS